MHDWFPIVFYTKSQRIVSTFKVRFEFFIPDIFEIYLNKGVSVRTGLLVKESNGMDEFMDNDSVPKTTSLSNWTLQRKGLSSSYFAEVGVATFVFCHPYIVNLIGPWTEIRNYLKSSPAGLVLEFAMWRHFDTKQLELIVSDCMDYPNPRFLKSKTKRRPHLLFLRLEADFAFATNSLNLKIVLDVWFGRDCVCSNIEYLSNIDEK